MQEQKTIEEKIDFIYNRLQKEERVEKREFLLKWGGRTLFGIFIGYMYFFGVNLIVEKTTEAIQTSFTESAGSVTGKVSDIYNSVKDKVTGGDSSGKTPKMSEEEMKRYIEF